MRNKKILFIFVMLSLLLSGCQKSSENEVESPTDVTDISAANNGEPIRYIPEYQILPDSFGIFQVSFYGDTVYFLMESESNGDLAAVQTEIYRGNVNNPQMEKMEIPLQEGETVQAICTVDTGGEEIIYLATGNVATCTNEAEKIYNRLISINKGGIIQETLDISTVIAKENKAVVAGMEVDGEGNIYLFTQDSNAIITLNPQGEPLFTYETDAFITDICNAHGKIYAAYFYGGMLTVAENSLSEQCFVPVYENKEANFNFLMAEGQENQLLFNTDGQIYEYNINTREISPLLEWHDCNINGTSIFNLKFLMDGRLFVVNKDGIQSEYIFLRAAEEGENPDAGKEILTVYFRTNDDAFTMAVNQFNKTNPDYRFEIIDYGIEGEELIERLNTELMAGEGADIMVFELRNGYNEDYITKKANTVFALNNYAEIGVFENLYDYMDADPDFHREDYFESILTALETNGQLYYIPLSFKLDTVMAMPSDVGGDMGWTLEEMISCAEDGFSISGMGSESTEQNVLEMCLRTGIQELIEGDTFNQELMLKILAFARQTAEIKRTGEPTAATDGLRLWAYGSVGDSNIEQTYAALYNSYGEHPTFIGYPGKSGSGTLVTSEAIAAINSNCSNKEAAWKLLRILLAPQMPTVSWGTSIRKDGFMRRLEWNEQYREDVLHLTDEEAAECQKKIVELIDSVDTVRIQTQVELIIMEEAEYYFQGVKSAEEVTDVIANRVTLYLDERK